MEASERSWGSRWPRVESCVVSAALGVRVRVRVRASASLVCEPHAHNKEPLELDAAVRQAANSPPPKWSSISASREEAGENKFHFKFKCNCVVLCCVRRSAQLARFHSLCLSSHTCPHLRQRRECEKSENDFSFRSCEAMKNGSARAVEKWMELVIVALQSVLFSPLFRPMEI